MFQGDTMQILSKVRAAEFPPPDEVIKDVPDKLYGILNQSLAKDPENRYSSCNQMLSDLEEAMYSFKRRPTARVLSEYMKGLFEKEIAAEERTMSALAGMDFEAAAEATLVPSGKKEETKKIGPVPAPDVTEKRFPKNLLLAAIGGIVIIVVLVIIFWPGEKSVPPKPEEAKTTIAEKQGKKAEKQAEVAQKEPAPAKKQKAAKTPKPATAAKGTEKLAKARQALDEKRYGEAVSLFEAALSENPSLKKEASEPYETAMREEAVSLMKTDPEKAEGLLLKAVEVNPKSVKSHSKLGILYVQEKKYEDAIQQYKTVSQLGCIFQPGIPVRGEKEIPGCRKDVPKGG